MSFAKTGKELENIILGKVSQTQKDKYFAPTYSQAGSVKQLH